jgi:hypothetical protein
LANILHLKKPNSAGTNRAIIQFLVIIVSL